MAGDGDMFAHRKAWGYNQLCAAASDGAPLERLAQIEIECIRNMLGNGYAVPSLKPSVQAAYAILKAAQTDLPLESASQRSARLIETVRSIEKDSVEAPSSGDIAKVVLSVGLKIVESQGPAPSIAEFGRECCQRLGEFWLHRYGWDSFGAYAMRRGQLAPEAYSQVAKTACEQAIPQISELIQESMISRGGRLPKRRKGRLAAVVHTREGLNEELT